ncbi:MAG: glycosyltransferase family 4 protein [Muribaculaceae bacterium]|nr:glycosyltransferase family 4 protein [Muribaculaceae bacterium]
MKIIQIFPGKIWGGAEQYVLDLGRELRRRGNDVIFMARDCDTVTDHLDRDGEKYLRLPFSWSLDRSAVKALASVMSDADVVHIHSVKFVPAAVMAKRISGSNANIVMTRHDAHRTPANIFFRPFFRQLHNIIFVSDMARRAWTGANRWFPAGKCKVVLNSIPPYEPEPVESLRDKYSIPPSTPLLLFSGRVKKTKGCEVLVKALCQLADREFAMVFIGSWNHRGYDRRLLSLAAKAGIADRIHFYGFTDKARHFIKQADIAVAPSVFRDPCPLSNLEFVQNGICEITTNNGGQAEYLVDGETALLVDPADHMQLARAIARVLDDKELRARLAAAGKAFYDANMTYDKFVDKITAIYR